jgi:hypothetical protein
VEGGVTAPHRDGRLPGLKLTAFPFVYAQAPKILVKSGEVLNVMVMRYAMLAAVGVASIWALITASANSGQWLLVDAGQGGGQADIAFWLLAAVAIVISLSLCRFLIFGLPSMFGSWYEQRKQWIYTLVGGALLYGVFYLM